jgi:dTDP-4-amino-4,6-dideoxygalactose transaminase
MVKETKAAAIAIAVPLLDLAAEYEGIRDEVLRAIERVLDSRQFILGPDIAVLESQIAAYCESRFAIGCASGSDALLLALMAFGIGAGDEVITTPYSFFATAAAITRLGARPVFVDIESDTFNINADLIEGAITERTKAIMPVHLYGQSAEMGLISEVAGRYAIPVIEDAAQAIGAEHNRRRVGSIGEIGCISFYPSKNLGGIGDGGMLTTNDDALARKLRMLRVHGSEVKYKHEFVGINSRLDSLQAAALNVKMPYLDGWSEQRTANALRYFDLFNEAGLAETVRLPVIRAGMRHIFNQFVISVARDLRDGLVDHLKTHSIGCDIYYPIPLHLQECFEFLGFREGDFPVAEHAARTTIAIPVFPAISLEQQQYVVDTIADFFDSAT